MIPAAACNVPGAKARGKLSTIPVDKSGDKFRPTGKILLIRLASLKCLLFGQLRNMLIMNGKFIFCGQIVEIIKLSVTLP